ncbi:uncharacterized protein LOC131994727 [Stomoxys calcitrans]|uniref:uncharacterized protein LOC131994727 n=1 Tax=Stomoxys calcitrans TaxID=35570 RepID=UPI0027E255E7|nr:uncharacterized protein LOC131994727 [Stomoxys calcitrans]
MRGNQKASKPNSKKPGQYVCRLCRWTHPLRKCKKFLEMEPIRRLQLVNKFGYCKNCLAHSHSQGSCFTTTGCRYCQKNHHSLLHMHKAQQQTRSQKGRPHSTQQKQSKNKSRSSKTPNSHPKPNPNPILNPDSNPNLKPTARSKSCENKSSNASLSAILKQNTVTLLPTVVVEIEGNKGKCRVRCLLDTGSQYSRISSSLVRQLGLTTLTLNEETICPIVLASVYDPDIRIEVTLRVTNRISVRTPGKLLSKSIKAKYTNIMLADASFYKPGPIDYESFAFLPVIKDVITTN